MMTKRVLFFAPFGGYHVHHQLDLIVGTSLRLRDTEVLAVRCDGLFPTCEVLAWSNGNEERDCLHCQACGNSLFASLDFPITQLRSFIQQVDVDEITAQIDRIDPENYQHAFVDDLAIGSWVLSTVFSFFKLNHAQLSLPHVRRAHRQFLINGLIVWRSLARIISEFRPTNMMAFNGRFAPYRIALELGRRLHIPVVTHERGIIDDTFILVDNHNCIENYIFRVTGEAWKDTPLTESELQITRDYFIDREFGKNTNYTSFVTPSTSKSDIKRQLRIPYDKRIVSIFTSSEFELAYCDDFKTEIPQMDLIQRIIDLFKDREEYLVIRQHPSIGGDEISPPEVNLIARMFEMEKRLPENVRMIMPSEKLNSYNLLAVTDATLGFLSTVAIESVARGVPTASLPESYYRDGMTILLHDLSPAGLNTAINYLLAQNATIDIDNYRRGYRYMHSMITKCSQKFKSFGIKDTFSADLRINQLEDLLPGGDASLDRVCDHILNNSPIIEVPGEVHKHRTQEEENIFFRNQIEIHKKNRNDIVDCFKDSEYESLSKKISIITSKKASEASLISNSNRGLLGEVIELDANEDLLVQLNKTLHLAHTPFVIIKDSRITLGEAALSTAIDELEKSDSRNLNGIRLAGWVLDEHEIPQRGVYSKRNPTSTFSDLQRISPILTEPLMLLSFYIFRKDYLRELVTYWENISSEQRLSEVIFSSLQNDSISHLLLQAVYSCLPFSMVIVT